jgi:hypothetical protein
VDPEAILPNVDWSLVQSWTGSFTGRFGLVIAVCIALFLGAMGVQALKKAVLG